MSYTEVLVGVLHLECDLQGNVGRQLHQYRYYSWKLEWFHLCSRKLLTLITDNPGRVDMLCGGGFSDRAREYLCIFLLESPHALPFPYVHVLLVYPVMLMWMYVYVPLHVVCICWILDKRSLWPEEGVSRLAALWTGGRLSVLTHSHSHSSKGPWALPPNLYDNLPSTTNECSSLAPNQKGSRNSPGTSQQVRFHNFPFPSSLTNSMAYCSIPYVVYYSLGHGQGQKSNVIDPCQSQMPTLPISKMGI